MHVSVARKRVWEGIHDFGGPASESGKRFMFSGGPQASLGSDSRFRGTFRQGWGGERICERPACMDEKKVELRCGSPIRGAHTAHGAALFEIRAAAPGYRVSDTSGALDKKAQSRVIWQAIKPYGLRRRRDRRGDRSVRRGRMSCHSTESW